MSKVKDLWLPSPTREDLAAAHNYLCLLSPQSVSRRLAHSLSRAKASRATAKDLLRASELPLLPREELHVKADLKRLRRGKSLSPVLLIRGNMSRGIPLVIADGYHRICAVCYFDEDAPIACRLVPIPR
jgi:hypothetical protein